MASVLTIALQYSHDSLEGIHVAKKHMITIPDLMEKVHSEMDHDIKE
jgi:hypothetical protein